MKKRSNGGSKTTIIREYFSVSEAANYIGISERLIRDFLKDPLCPIPYYRIGSAGRLIRLKKSDIEKWLENFKSTCDINIDEIVNALMN